MAPVQELSIIFVCDRFDVREKRYECKFKIVINHSVNVYEERGAWSLLIHRPISRRTDVTAMASSGSALFPHLVRRLILHTRPQVHRRAKSECEGQDVVFDTTLLDYIVCPVSKKPLRYDASSKELVNEELSIAYPVVNGIPQLVPGDSRKLQPKDSISTGPPAS